MDEIISIIDTKVEQVFYKASLLSHFIASVDLLFYVSEYLQVHDLCNLLLTCKQTYRLRSIPIVQIRIIKMQIQQLGIPKHINTEEQANMIKIHDIAPIKPIIFTPEFLNIKTTAQRLIMLKQANNKNKKQDVKMRKNPKRTQIHRKKSSEKSIKKPKLQKSNNSDFNDQLKQLLRKKYIQLKTNKQKQQKSIRNSKRFLLQDENEEFQKIQYKKNGRVLHLNKLYRQQMEGITPLDKLLFEQFIMRKQERLRMNRQATFFGKLKNTFYDTKEKISKWVSSQP